jgi:hypothetical protein
MHVCELHPQALPGQLLLPFSSTWCRSVTGVCCVQLPRPQRTPIADMPNSPVPTQSSFGDMSSTSCMAPNTLLPLPRSTSTMGTASRPSADAPRPSLDHCDTVTAFPHGLHATFPANHKVTSHDSEHHKQAEFMSRPVFSSPSDVLQQEPTVALMMEEETTYSVTNTTTHALDITQVQAHQSSLVLPQHPSDPSVPTSGDCASIPFPSFAGTTLQIASPTSTYVPLDIPIVGDIPCAYRHVRAAAIDNQDGLRNAANAAAALPAMHTSLPFGIGVQSQRHQHERRLQRHSSILSAASSISASTRRQAQGRGPSDLEAEAMCLPSNNRQAANKESLKPQPSIRSVKQQVQAHSA